MKYHITAFFSGFLLDMLLGDPAFFPHPVRLIGYLIEKTESFLRKDSLRRNISYKSFSGGNSPDENFLSERGEARKEKKELKQGGWLVILVTGVTVVMAGALLFAAYFVHPVLGTAAETVMTYQILSAKCLKVESTKVCRYLEKQDLERARYALAMIVGRDTECLDEERVAKAAIETVAENTSDGVIAPMLYTALGGPILGFWYKAVNTMDSMVGYKNERYLWFGRAAARLDDLANFFPARISACLMIAASFLAEKCFGRAFQEKISWKRALAVYRRDRKKHVSPNAAQTESVCAGALGLRLAGDASYFGRVVEKPYIGDALRKAEPEDIRRANRLMYLTAFIGEGICLLLMAWAAWRMGV